MKKAESMIRKLFDSVDIEINGKNSWDPQIHNIKFYDRVLGYGSLGMGESYMENWWDCRDLAELFYRILRNNLQNEIRPLKFIFPVIKQNS
jgi:cyclopropane-fatty-acyl-phospholipid synthase